MLTSADRAHISACRFWRVPFRTSRKPFNLGRLSFQPHPSHSCGIPFCIKMLDDCSSCGSSSCPASLSELRRERGPVMITSLEISGPSWCACHALAVMLHCLAKTERQQLSYPIPCVHNLFQCCSCCCQPCDANVEAK